MKFEPVETWQVLVLCFEPHVLTSHEAPSMPHPHHEVN